MTQSEQILSILTINYSLCITNIEFFRDAGSLSYIVYAGERKLFLRIVRPELMHTALRSTDIHQYLAENSIPVPPILFTKDKIPYVCSEEPDGKHLYILYEYIEGHDPAAEDIEKAGELVGRFHSVMQDYCGKLTVQDKYFFIDRYVDILRKKQYPRWNAFKEYGDAVWGKVKGLPRGYCHCDLYRNNIYKAEDGELYILDFDTSCNAFPMYDIALFCNETDYFKYDDDAYERTQATLESFLRGYSKFWHVSKAEILSVFDLLAVYHFQLQATIIEIYGLDCVDEEFLDNQLDWLVRWHAQCTNSKECI